jgi:hypothetical protein
MNNITLSLTDTFSDGSEKVEHGDYKKKDSGKYPPKTPLTVITGGF